MRQSLILIIAISLFCACSKKSADKVEPCVPWSTYTFKSNDQLYDTTVISGKDTFHFTSEVPGNNIVFKYIRTNGVCGGDPPSIAQTLTFQVNSNLTSFESRDSSLLDIIYSYEPGFAFQPQQGYPHLGATQKITKGVISGSKVDNYKWNISVDIKPIQSPPITFNTTFYLYQ